MKKITLLLLFSLFLISFSKAKAEECQPVWNCSDLADGCYILMRDMNYTESGICFYLTNATFDCNNHYISGWLNGWFAFGDAFHMFNSTLKNCRLEGLLHAVMIGSDNTIVNSTFWFNNYAVDSEWGGWRNIIKNNIFIDNMNGLSYTEAGGNDTITENCFISYYYEALLMNFYSSRSHYIYNNYITLRRLIAIQPDNVLYWNNTTTGNYWEDYAKVCNDTDNNGICDEPLILDENNVDYFPLKTPTFECFIPSVCGNGICESGEDYINCPQDCPPPPPPPTPPKPICRICDYSQLNPKDATQSVFVLLCLILNVIFCNPILASLFFLFILIFCLIIYLRKGGYV